MIRHLVLLQLNPECPPEAVEAIAEGLRELPQAITEIRTLECGPDVGELHEGFNFAISADFEDLVAYRVYARHPAHRRVIEELLSPWVESRCRAQIQLQG